MFPRRPCAISGDITRGSSVRKIGTEEATKLVSVPGKRILHCRARTAFDLQDGVYRNMHHALYEFYRESKKNDEEVSV